MTAIHRARRRGDVIVGLAVGLVCALAFGSAASATKYFDSFFGGNSVAPHLGGLFSSTNGVGDVAVNETSITTDGTAQAGYVYVLDRGNNRVQVFDANKVFQFAIGRDVVQPGGAGDTNERQTVTIGGSPTGGTFTLTFGANTTAPIPFDAPASGAGSVQEALQAIASVGAANATVTGPAGGPYAVEFVGARASIDHGAMPANGSGLTPAGTVSVAVTQDGASFEKCTVASQCKAGTTLATATLGNRGTFSVAEGVDVDQDTGHFFVSERTQRRVQEFEADGDFVRLWGWNVVKTGSPSNVPINEKQTITLDPNADGGTFTLQFPSFIGPTTAGIPSEASAAAVESALNGLASIGSGGTSVTGPAGGPWAVEFTGALADTDVDQPSISGANLTTAVGTTLNCNAGPAGATFTYRWLRNGAEIAGATSPAYTTVIADAGAQIQCASTASNADGATAKTSTPPRAITPASPVTAGTPTISPSTTNVGAVQTCAAGTWTPAPTFAFQWLRNGAPIVGATSSTYTPVAADLGEMLQCQVIGTSASGAAMSMSTPRQVVGLIPTASANPTISGSFNVGDTPTCTNGTWTASPSFAYEWLRNGVPIVGATASSYTVVAADAGTVLQCRVTATNATTSLGATRAVSVNSVVPPAPGTTPPALTTVGTVTGSNPPAVGNTLTCNRGTWANAPTSYTFQWLRNGVPIPGESLTSPTQTSFTYTVAAADVEKTLQCQVTATNAGGSAVATNAASSNGVRYVNPPVPLTATAAVTPPLSADVTMNVVGANAFETCIAVAGDVCQAATMQAGTNPGQFGLSSTNKHGLATALPMASNAGEVYVADPGNRRVVPFTVPANPAAPVVAEPTFGSADEFLAAEWPRDLAADPNAVVYASAEFAGTSNANANGAVVRYDTDADVVKAPISPQLDDDFFDRSPPAGLAVEYSNGHLFVGRAPGTGGDDAAFPAGLIELDVSDNPDTVDASDVVELHGVGLGSIFSATSPTAVGVGNGRFYLATSATAAGTGTGNRIVVMDDDGVNPPPTVDLLPPTEIGCTTATLRADINPNGPTGFATNYRFQVSKTGADSDWTDVAPEALVGATGDGSVPVHVDDQATGLEANTTYRLRVRTTRNPAAGVALSAELPLITDPCPPTVETIAAQHVAATSAQLVGRLNPGGEATSYWFEWGDDSYGNQIPLPSADAGSGSVAKLVAADLTGLDPERVYHFRLCARNLLAPAGICGADRTLTTRATTTNQAAGRSFEMVTSPVKVLRRGGERGFTGPFADYGRLQSGLPSPDGDAVLWHVFAGVSDPDAGNGFAHDRAREVRRRTSVGWIGDAVTNIAPVRPVTAADSILTGISADLDTQAWWHQGYMFESGDKPSTRVMGDSGGPRGAGWYPWPGGETNGDAALIDDTGQRALRWHPSQSYRDLQPIDDDVPPTGLNPPQTSGGAVFLTGPPTWGPLDLINECSGAGGNATAVIARVGTGAPTDTIGERTCELGSPTDVRGAIAGGGSAVQLGPLGGTATTAMSEDGRRVFFVSPDPGAGPSTSCQTTVDSQTSCPPQLFVRTYDEGGQPMVRWISRAAPSLFAAQQRIGLAGAVAFEGASRDGNVVYFRTNAPLTGDDPNGTGVVPASPGVVTGSASPNSWDLYRYELPEGSDPASGTLTRVSGGHGGTADPNTNCPTISAGDCANGGGDAARFISNDGDRAYFVTAARIPGADNSSPAGGSTNPTGLDEQVNTETRNLYLYDAGKSETAAYRFVARIPFGTAGAGGPNACASFNRLHAGASRRVASDSLTATIPAIESSCVHGTSDGDAVVFETAGQLTADDTDSATDVYLYDASTDELIRVSAPPPSGVAYDCLTESITSTTPAASCNGDLGFQAGAPHPSSSDNIGLSGLRHRNLAEKANGTLAAVFFESRLELVHADKDGDRMDVYEWRDGVLRLITPDGAEDRDAFYTGNSRDGEDVFFWTEQRIDAREIDEADGDVYDARVGSGFPPPPPPPVTCLVLGGACHGGGAAPLDSSAPTIGAGGGDAVPGTRSAIALRGPTAAQRRQAARTGILRVPVKASGGGKLTAVARARLHGRLRSVGRASERVTAAGTTRLTIRLSDAALQALRQGRRLKVRITVRMTDARARTVTAVLRRAGK